MQNTSPRVVGRRAVIKGTALLAASATARAQGQPPPAEQATTLADVPLAPSVTVTVERRGDIVLVGLNRPFIQNRIDPPTRLRLAAIYYQYEHDASLRALVCSSATAKTSHAALTSTPRRRESFQGNAR